jgi:hypothetical protein
LRGVLTGVTLVDGSVPATHRPRVVEASTLKRTTWFVLVGLLVALAAPADRCLAQRPLPGAPEGRERKKKDVTLEMTPAVACLSIDGQGQYEPMPEAALTSDEKLLVFYRPLKFHIQQNGSSYRFHLVQDGRVRPQGSPLVLQTKLKMIDEDWNGKEPPGNRFMRSQVSLKGLPPGEYDFEITLHDLLAPGKPTARQTLPFRVIVAGPLRGNELP